LNKRGGHQMKSDLVPARQKMYVAELLCNTVVTVSYNKATGSITIYAGTSSHDLSRALRELVSEAARLSANKEREEALHVRRNDKGDKTPT
ncbi:hypothetical protein V6O07_11895, partial [Arthrospira platensis SPKY2]